MPKPKFPRTPIQLLTKAEIADAELCAQALWHGISYKDGSVITSDAELLDRFATPFYDIPTNHKYITSKNYLHDLIVACELKVLYKGGAGMDFQKGLDCVEQDVYPNVYSYWPQRNNHSYPFYGYGARSIKLLSKGLSKSATGERTVLASRMMFFIAPDMQCFNMNNKVAVAYGLSTVPQYYRDDYCALMSDGLKTNAKLLGACRT